ncbi:MAG: hypothetical protein K6A23_05935 [Butyrivibrio sp.]|nr:hypothetical protein [Butyrivibrio sp.]
MKKIVVTAHAGAENTNPNTEASIIECMKLPCDVVEVDIRKINHKYILSHDKTDRTDGFVQLNRAIEIASYFNKPLNLDLKEEHLYTELCRMPIIQNNKELIFFSGSVMPNELEKEPYYSNKTFMNIENMGKLNTEDIAKRCKELNVLGINIDVKQLNKKIANIFNFYGIKISAWTVDNVMEFKKSIVPYRVEYVTTNMVKEIQDLCSQVCIE